MPVERLVTSSVPAHASLHSARPQGAPHVEIIALTRSHVAEGSHPKTLNSSGTQAQGVGAGSGLDRLSVSSLVLAFHSRHFLPVAFRALRS